MLALRRHFSLGTNNNTIFSRQNDIEGFLLIASSYHKINRMSSKKFMKK